MTAEKAQFRFTDEQWADYQALPDQGYSHRRWLEHTFNRWMNGPCHDSLCARNEGHFGNHTNNMGLFWPEVIRQPS